MRKLPAKSVKCGASRYKLVLDPSLKDSEFWGRVHYKKETITLDPKLGKSVFKYVLLHELLHVVDFQRGLNLKESQIEALAFGLIDLLKDNRWIGPFLVGDKNP